MVEYPKIQSVFKRDEKTHKFIVGDWALPEFEYLQSNIWDWTEKVNGTNIKVMWLPEWKEVHFGGKTDDAQIPAFLLEKLKELFSVLNLREVFPDYQACLYGEGYGAKIQKGGGKYIPGGVDFVLIDVLVGTWWLQRHNIEDIASKLGIKCVPIVGIGSIHSALELTKAGFNSTWGDFLAEGLVLKPKVHLVNRRGERIITKMKYKDFGEVK